MNPLVDMPECVCNHPPCDGVCWYGKQRKARSSAMTDASDEAARRWTALCRDVDAECRREEAYAAGWRAWGGPKR